MDQQIEDFALLVDGAPQVHPPAGDPHDHLVEVPSVHCLSGAAICEFALLVSYLILSEGGGLQPV